MKRIIDKQTKLFLRDDFDFNPETEMGLQVEPSQGLYQPRWNGESWEEAGTPPEQQPQEPTETERIEALEQALLEIVLGGVF